jgi:serine/threonine protein phosphatase PrpC
VPLVSIDSFVLMKALPSADLEPSISTIDVKPHDRIIIMSDGIYKSALTPDMEKVLTDPANSEAEKAAKALVQLTIKQGRGPDDDATAVVINL